MPIESFVTTLIDWTFVLMTPTKWAFVEVMCSDLACGWFWGDLWWVNVVICDVWCYVTMLSSTTPLLPSTTPVPLRTAKYHSSTTKCSSSTTKYYSRKHNTTTNTQTKNLKTPPQTHQAPFTPGTCYTKHLVHQTPLPMSPCLHLFNSVEAARKDMRRL